MTNEEVIEQLKSLRDHCESMKEEWSSEDIWNKDVIALNIAIETIKKSPQLPAK